MMENLILSPAICPGCKRFIDAVQTLTSVINAREDSAALKKILSGKANLITCPHCGGEFYFEKSCLVFNFDKDYAVVCLATDLKPTVEKTAIFNILGKPYMRFRLVREFICLIEKVRIFEFNLDDRALENVKYKYLKAPHNINDNAKIILDGADERAMVFGIYDEFDRKTAEHRVSLDAYRREYKSFDREIIDGSITQWKEIDTSWAKFRN